MKKFFDLLTRNISNIIGWNTTRKIVVLESDDWGSIRMPSKNAYEELLNLGIKINKCPYNRYDSLESKEDLDALYDVLFRFKDKSENHPVITTNTVVANPDFEKIKLSNFKEYYFEPFTETLKRYSQHKNTFESWENGIKEKLIFPQFHGREHVNVNLWLKLLQNGNDNFNKAFQHGLWGIGPEIIDYGKIHIQASFDTYDVEEIKSQKEIITSGLHLFKDIFGFKSRSFIANNFIWDASLNSTLKDEGIDFIQGMRYQLLPLCRGKRRGKIYHYIGQKNIIGQTFIVRNCNFDQSETPEIDNVTNCLKQIKNAFFWHKPAVISTHRLNYIGTIDKNNRSNTLLKLNELFEKLIKIWPEIEFLNSVQLGEMMSNCETNN